MNTPASDTVGPSRITIHEPTYMQSVPSLCTCGNLLYNDFNVTCTNCSKKSYAIAQGQAAHCAYPDSYYIANQ